MYFSRVFTASFRTTVFRNTAQWLLNAFEILEIQITAESQSHNSLKGIETRHVSPTLKKELSIKCFFSAKLPASDFAKTVGII